MQSTIFNTPVLKVESLKSKFDTNVLSNSVVALLDNNYIEARILQQLHYWCYSQYGVIIDGIRWIYKPLREWLSEALAGVTNWKLRVAIASLLEKGLIKREKLYVKHHELKHDNPYWHPKNQTYYYSVNYDKLQELIDRVENQENPETTENVRFENSTILSVEDFQDTKFCELSQNNTKKTNIENNSKNKSHPTLPSERNISKPINQEKDFINTSELFLDVRKEKNADIDPEVIEKETNSADVENKVNENIDTTPDIEFVKPNGVFNPQVSNPLPKTKQPREKKAPWKDEGQFKRFYRALIQALPIVANARSPQGLAQTIIRQLRCGIPHTYWDDFVADLPIGASTKPEWEVEPGVPYPMFVEYLTEKLKAGNNSNSDEQTRNEVFRILSQPRQASAFWGQFKRSVVNVAEQVERDRALGVSNPNTPVWTRERIEPSIEEAEEAGEKIMAINGTAQAAIIAAKTPPQESLSSSAISDPWTDDLSLLSRPDGLPPEAEDKPSNGGTNGDNEVYPLGHKSPEAEDLSSNGDKYPFRDEKSQPSMRELLTKKLGLRNLKGFCKQMPKVSRAEDEVEAKKESEALQRQQMNYKTHLSQMSVDEINELVKDPIVRKELTPQIIFNEKFDIVTDNLGEVLAVKISQEYLKNGGT